MNHTAVAGTNVVEYAPINFIPCRSYNAVYHPVHASRDYLFATSTVYKKFLSDVSCAMMVSIFERLLLDL